MDNLLQLSISQVAGINLNQILGFYLQQIVGLILEEKQLTTDPLASHLAGFMPAGIIRGITRAMFWAKKIGENSSMPIPQCPEV